MTLFGPGVDEVHVWWLRLCLDAAAEARAWAVLGADERAHAQRLKRDSDRGVHVRTRAFVRSVLGGYLSVPAAEVAIVKGDNDKPELGGTSIPNALHFNVSHSGGLALIAVSTGHEVGVDVERIDEHLRWRDVADRFLSRVEVHAIDRLREVDQRRAFFECWVRKEAYLKGVGTGFRRETTNFSVPLAGDCGAVNAADLAPLVSPPVWHVHRLDLDAQYAAAVAVPADGVTPMLRRWSESAASRTTRRSRPRS